MKLLLIEDDPKISAAVKRGLEAEGFQVESAFNGDDGYWMASEGDFDLVLLDILLPGRNGYRVCADLRANGKQVPILMLTAKNGDLDEAEGLDTGADDYLTKPFSFPVLVARVKALLRRGQPTRQGLMTFGDLRIDPDARRTWVVEQEVELTSREFAVLELFATRSGDVLSKEQILAAVWEMAFEGDPNIVEVFVSRLRRKLEDPFGRKFLHTVRGAGYRFEAPPSKGP